MTTESIRVDVADDGGSTRKLVDSTNQLAGALDKAAAAEGRAQTALAKVAAAANTAAGANANAARSTEQISASTAKLQSSYDLLSRAGAGASSAANSLSAATTNASSGLSSYATAGDRAAGVAATFGQRTAGASAALGNVGTAASAAAKPAAALGYTMKDLATGVTRVVSPIGDAGAALGAAGRAAGAAASPLAGAGTAATGAASGLAGAGSAATTAGGFFGRLGTAAASMGGVLSRTGSGVLSMTTAFGNLRTALAGTTSQFGLLGAALGPILGYFATSKLVEYADTWTNMTNKLKLAVDNNKQLKSAMDAVFKISQETRTEMASNTKVYAGLADALRGMRRDTAEAGPLLKTVAQAVALSGASSEEAANSLRQFGQALNSPTVQAEELNSIIDQTPALAKALADGMRMNLGDFKKSLESGSVTARQVVDALRSQAENINAAFQKMTPTLSQSFTVLNNALVRYVGQGNETNGITAQISKAIIGLSNNLDTAIPIAIAFAAALASVAVFAVISAFAGMVMQIGLLITAMVQFTAAILLNPVMLGTLVVAVIAAVAAFKMFGGEISNAASQIPIIGGYLQSYIDKLNGSATAHIDAYNQSKKGSDIIEEYKNRIGQFTGGLGKANGALGANAGAAAGAATAMNFYKNALDASIERNEEFYQSLTAKTATAMKEYAVKAAQGKLVTTEWDDALGRYIVKVEQADGSVQEFGKAVQGYSYGAEQATSATNGLSSAMQQASDSARGYGAALYGVSDAQNNLQAITGQTTAEIEKQIAAIASASTYVDRYNNSVSAMTANLDSGWGGTKGTISIPSFSYPGAPQIVVGAGGSGLTDFGVQYMQQQQAAWNKQLADLEEHGAVQDGRVNANSDYIKAHPEILKQINNAMNSGSGNLNRDSSNFLIAGKPSADPTATKSTSSTASASNLETSRPVYTQPDPVYTQPVTTTPSTGSGASLDTGATADELTGLAGAAHVAALALNSIYSVLKGEGLTTFASDGVPGTGSTSAQPGTGIGLTGQSGGSLADVGTVPDGMGTGTAPTASTALNDNAPVHSGLMLDIQAVGEAVDALNAKMPPSIDGRGGGQYSGMTYQQIADAMIANGSKTESDLYRPVENTTTNNKKIGTVNVFIGVKDTSQLGLNAKQKAQDMARELAKAI